ncbi:uncharacterized protein LOC130458930 [Monodelphis domestica]|uniref:uncharacterized protein LOC130458930 n=1 Tax=Monodelphis domestica TaxID=13616 RepID=UPI0024E208E0|nr:uncharacterized protein LOC130458930 [Monodelphis domestica]
MASRPPRNTTRKRQNKPEKKHAQTAGRVARATPSAPSLQLLTSSPCASPRPSGWPHPLAQRTRSDSGRGLRDLGLESSAGLRLSRRGAPLEGRGYRGAVARRPGGPEVRFCLLTSPTSVFFRSRQIVQEGCIAPNGEVRLLFLCQPPRSKSPYCTQQIHSAVRSWPPDLPFALLQGAGTPATAAAIASPRRLVL